jgi:hypothetical protein
MVLGTVMLLIELVFGKHNPFFRRPGANQDAPLKEAAK